MLAVMERMAARFGEAVTIGSDTPTALVRPVDRELVDGVSVRATDLLVIVPSSQVAARPAAGSFVTIGAVAHRIESVTERRVTGISVCYELIARGNTS